MMTWLNLEDTQEAEAATIETIELVERRLQEGESRSESRGEAKVEPLCHVTAKEAAEAVAAMHTVRLFMDKCCDSQLAPADIATLGSVVDWGEQIKELRRMERKIRGMLVDIQHRINTGHGTQQSTVFDYFKPAGNK